MIQDMTMTRSALSDSNRGSATRRDRLDRAERKSSPQRVLYKNRDGASSFLHHRAFSTPQQASQHLYPSTAMFTTLIAAVLAASSVSAASLATRASTTCETRFAGILAAQVGDGFKSFVLSPRNQIAYVGDGQDPLVAEFQECTAEESSPHNATILTGAPFFWHILSLLLIALRRTPLRAGGGQVLRDHEGDQHRAAVLHDAAHVQHRVLAALPRLPRYFWLAALFRMSPSLKLSSR